MSSLIGIRNIVLSMYEEFLQVDYSTESHMHILRSVECTPFFIFRLTPNAEALWFPALYAGNYNSFASVSYTMFSGLLPWSEAISKQCPSSPIIVCCVVRINSDSAALFAFQGSIVRPFSVNMCLKWLVARSQRHDNRLSSLSR